MDARGDRIAGAPASWGICELPGWGHQLSPERVLHEMRDVGLRATELGPDEFWPQGPVAQHEVLDRVGLAAIGAFCPLVLHDPSRSPAPMIDLILDRFVTLGADRMVIAAATGADTYDERPQLSREAWVTLVENLERAVVMAAERGIEACVHPHVGTVIEGPREVSRILEHSAVPLCVDTGHLLVAGNDPLQLVVQAPGRIVHVHLKDVDATLLASVRSSERTYMEAVRLGLYTPLGQGDVDLVELVRRLEASGYRGWYVPEQDRMLVADPGRELISEIRSSLEFLRNLLPSDT